MRDLLLSRHTFRDGRGSMANAAEFAIVPTDVSDAGKFAQDTATNLIAGIQSADADVKALEATWKGNAARAYIIGWESARAAAVEVLDALTAMGELLGVTVAQLDAQDARNAADIAGFLDLPPL
ncbi:WXG100 family type VII secretion target [Nocardia stercoris]|uniref:WXG100 family type VII secretion target n=1 Tax=Nocardia stercoris TaxID=2483361 RepID=UPI00131A28D2|nr:WXG100 family type VII secretion target [Nocardia stercoris]